MQDHCAPRMIMRVKNVETINERARGLRLAGEVVKYLFGARSIPTSSLA